MVRPSIRNAAAFAFLILLAGPAAANEISFAGKKIDMLIGSSPGGGTDLSSRLIGDYLVKYLPGHPTIVYRNIPGGQGLKSLNYFATQVKPDGLTFSGGSQGHFDPAGRGQASIQFDPLTFKYIGGVNRGGTMMIVRKEALKRLADPTAKRVIMPAETGAGASTGPQMALWGMEYLHWNMRVVVGYSGTPAMILAAMQGEADCMASSSSSQLQPLLDNPAFELIAQLGDMDENGKFVPRSSLKNVPVFADMVGPKVPSDKQDLFRAWLQTQYIDKWFALPANTPDDIVKVYEAAFRHLEKDADFIRAAKLQFGPDFGTTSAHNMTGLVGGMVKNAARVDAFMASLRQKYGVEAK